MNNYVLFTGTKTNVYEGIDGGLPLPVQVSWSLDHPDTRHRELVGLLKACRKTGSDIGIVITFENEEFLVENGIKIHIIPAWKWCASR